jgi:hypothetical protein
MNRWSLSNLLLPISHEQFVDLTTQFKKAAEYSFGTKCKLQISALSDVKHYTTYDDDDIQRDLDEHNKKNTILETANLGEISKDLWKRAAYVSVTVTPVDAAKATQYAFGTMEFKGICPKQATFYIQSDDESVRKYVLSLNRTKLVGDGFDSNGIRSGSLPASLVDFFPH